MRFSRDFHAIFTWKSREELVDNLTWFFTWKSHTFSHDIPVTNHMIIFGRDVTQFIHCFEETRNVVLQVVPFVHFVLRQSFQESRLLRRPFRRVNGLQFQPHISWRCASSNRCNSEGLITRIRSAFAFWSALIQPLYSFLDASSPAVGAAGCGVSPEICIRPVSFFTRRASAWILYVS